MKYVIGFIIFFIVFYVLMLSQWFFLWQHARRRGLFQKDKLTMFDVRQLILSGEKDLAIFVYQMIFKVNHRRAREEIEALAKNIFGKKNEVE